MRKLCITMGEHGVSRSGGKYISCVLCLSKLRGHITYLRTSGQLGGRVCSEA